MNDRPENPEAEALNPEHVDTMLYALRCGSLEYAKKTRDQYFPSNSITQIPEYEEAVIEGLNRRGRVDKEHLPYGTVDNELAEIQAFHQEFGRALIRLSNSEGYQKLLAGTILTTLNANELSLELVDEAIEIYELFGEGVDLSKIKPFVARIKQIFEHHMELGKLEIAVKLRVGLGSGMDFEQ